MKRQTKKEPKSKRKASGEKSESLSIVMYWPKASIGRISHALVWSVPLNAYVDICKTLDAACDQPSERVIALLSIMPVASFITASQILTVNGHSPQPTTLTNKKKPRSNSRQSNAARNVLRCLAGQEPVPNAAKPTPGKRPRKTTPKRTARSSK